MNTALQHALTDPGEPTLRELPADAAELLLALGAPPRLAAHVRAVHDVAHQLTGWLGAHHPELRFDREAVLFGAATHDIGKAVHTAELSGPGSKHEEAGQRLLLEAGIDPRLARFAATHATWGRDDIELEDLLVSLADQVWKAKRVADLEQLVVDRLAVASQREPWQIFMDLDDYLDHLAAGADHRLDFQNSYPIVATGGTTGPLPQTGAVDQPARPSATVRAVLSPEHSAEIDSIIDRVTRWAARRPDVVGLLLVGSCARGAAGPDSDIDLILLVEDEAQYADDVWTDELALGELTRTQSWGPITERRFATGAGLEVEINIGSPEWAAVDPVDAGTRRVVADGARILHDPSGMLAALVDACQQ